jgi:aspartyl-tRNA(Asn)/glutamyl-tRNA(Gln) amidotransferase subunit A
MSARDELTEMSASELAHRYLRRELSPLEVVHAVLERIQRHEPQVNAFVSLDAEAALAAAARSEQRFLLGTPMGELDGVPIGIKDLIDVRGFATRKGSRTTPEQRAEHDAPVAARLREQGAILLGKTTTSEFGLKGLGESPLTGITRNPWDLSRSSGGSSAGSVAAVAAGFGPVSIGTDGGGSVRVPSAYAGVVGLKPSFGRVATLPPLLAGVPPLVGPITRSVADTVLVLRAIARPDPRDAWSLGHAAFERERSSLHGVRVAYSADLGFAQLAPDVRRAFEAAVARLSSLHGVQLEPAHPDIGPQSDALRTLFEARAAETLRAIAPERRALVDPDVRAAAEAGERLRAADVLEAEAQRSALITKLSAFHARFDLLLTPTTAFTAPPAEPRAGAPELPRSPFAAAFSLSRQPAISVPCGLGDDGLPIGLQIVGRHFEEDLVLSAAWAFESTGSFPFRASFQRANQG